MRHFRNLLLGHAWKNLPTVEHWEQKKTMVSQKLRVWWKNYLWFLLAGYDALSLKPMGLLSFTSGGAGPKRWAMSWSLVLVLIHRFLRVGYMMTDGEFLWWRDSAALIICVLTLPLLYCPSSLYLSLVSLRRSVPAAGVHTVFQGWSCSMRTASLATSPQVQWMHAELSGITRQARRADLHPPGWWRSSLINAF